MGSSPGLRLELAGEWLSAHTVQTPAASWPDRRTFLSSCWARFHEAIVARDSAVLLGSRANFAPQRGIVGIDSLHDRERRQGIFAAGRRPLPFVDRVH